MAEIIDLARVKRGESYYLERNDPHEKTLCKVELSAIASHSDEPREQNRYARYDLLSEGHTYHRFHLAYNYTWRLWDTRPTEAEMDAAAWESDELPF